MTLLIKICGMTQEEDIEAAVEAGADAVGFVFHEDSPRNLTPKRAAELARRVPERVLRVAVTLHPSQAQVDRILNVFAPDVWQSDSEDFRAIRMPASVQCWPVLRSGGSVPASLPRTLLFDAAVSGSGMRADWARASRLARRGELILGGGLTPATVAGAIEEVNPLGVDVSSGVERSVGVKDAKLIREFVAVARAADWRERACTLR